MLHNLILFCQSAAAYGTMAAIQTEQNTRTPVTEIRSRMETDPFALKTDPFKEPAVQFGPHVRQV